MTHVANWPDEVEADHADHKRHHGDRDANGW